MIAEQGERDSEGPHLREPESSHAHYSTAFRRELVRRVVQSLTFARSERLGTLLTYICEMALKGPEAELNEQKIGQEVFGRSEYYDSTVDGIVRTQESQLADLKGANVILIGAQEADPWFAFFQPNLSFEMLNDQRTTVFTVLNRAPLANETNSYQYDPQLPGSKAYAVISFRSNLNGRGNVLIVEGTGIAGIETAAEFILDSSRFEQVLRPIIRDHKLTGHFDVLLRTDPLNGTAPRTDLISVRYLR